MGILAVDELMLREPRLLVPGMQPLGPVAVDTIHPIGCKCRFLNLGTGGGTNDLLSAPGVLTGELLMAVTSNAVTRKAAVVSGTGITFARAPITAADYSIVVVAGRDGSADNVVSFVFHTFGTSNIIQLAFSMTGATGGGSAGTVSLLELRTAVSRVYANAASAFGLSEPMSVWCATRTASVLAIDKNGVDITTATSSGAGVLYSALTSTTIHAVSGTSLNRGWWAAMIGAFQPALTPSERASIGRDPYQFLVPA